MTPGDELDRFISGTFPSVWALELLLHLKTMPGSARSKAELVADLRASEPIVAGASEALVAAGLLVVEEGGGLRYAPASRALARLADAAQDIYARRPDAVRRIIVSASRTGLDAFADAFRLRKD